MIISKKYAQKLVREGKATIENCATTGVEEGRKAVLVTRHDVQRMDHYLLPKER